MRTNNMIEWTNREIRLGAPRGGDIPGWEFRPDAGLRRLRHVAGTQWGNKKYMNMKHLKAALDDASIAG